MIFDSGSGGTPIRIWSSDLVVLVLEASLWHGGATERKLRAFVANDDDARERLSLLQDIVVGAPLRGWFPGENLCSFGLGSDDALSAVLPLGALS